MKVLMWNKAGGNSAYYVTLTEISHTGVVTVISGEVNIMTTDARMVYNCVTSLNGNSGGIRPANNYKGLYTITKVMYLYQNVTTSARLEVRILDIAGNTLTNGSAYTVKVNTTDPGYAGGLVSLQDDRVIIHDVYYAQLFTVKWTGNVITQFGNQAVGQLSSLSSDVYPLTYPSIVRIGGDCVARLSSLGNTHSTSIPVGNYAFRILSFDKCYNDATNTFKKYKSIILHYLKENGSNGDGVAKPEPTINDPSLMQTEDGLCFYDKSDRNNVTYTTVGFGVFKFLNFYESLNGFYLIKENKLNNIYFLKSIRETYTSALNNFNIPIFGLEDPIKNNQTVVLDKNRVIFFNTTFNSPNFRSYLIFYKLSNGIVVSETEYELFTIYTLFVVKLISQSENGDFKILIVGTNNSNLIGSILSYTFSTDSFSLGVSNNLFVGSAGLSPNIELLQNDRFIVCFNNANQIYLRTFRIIGNTITQELTETLFSAYGYGYMFKKLAPNIFVVTYFSINTSGDNWQRFIRIYSISSNSNGILAQSLAGSVTQTSPYLNISSPILRGDIIPLEGLRFLCFDFGHPTASVSSNRVFNRMSFYEYSPTMSNEHSYLSPLKSSIMNYGLQDTMGVSDGGNGGAYNITHYNQILAHVKLSETKIAFAILKGGTKKICIEVYEIHANGFKLLYSNPIWYVNEYVNTTQTNTLIGLGQSCDFYIKLDVIDGIIYYSCIVSTFFYAKPTFIFGKVTPRNYLGMVCKVKQNSIVVTKKPIKLDKNYEAGSYFLVTKDGCKNKTKKSFLNPDINGFNDPNDASLLSKYEGEPYAIVDKNNYLRFVKNPNFSNNGW